MGVVRVRVGMGVVWGVGEVVLLGLGVVLVSVVDGGSGSGVVWVVVGRWRWLWPWLGLGWEGWYGGEVVGVGGLAGKSCHGGRAGNGGCSVWGSWGLLHGVMRVGDGSRGDGCGMGSSREDVVTGLGEGRGCDWLVS